MHSIDLVVVAPAGRTWAGQTEHPLDRPIWTALTTRQSHLAMVWGGARRFDPAFSPFGGIIDGTADSFSALADIVPVADQVSLEGEELDVPSGFVLRSAARTVIMVAEHIVRPTADFPIEVLTAADAPEMRSLAQLTKPGPFAERTHELGCFVGVRHEGRLVAMAGERLKAGAFTEVSGVCTHPDHRGKGYAAGLMCMIAAGILERGETPFLHSYADNVKAIKLYERLGFAVRSHSKLFTLERV